MRTIPGLYVCKFALILILFSSSCYALSCFGLDDSARKTIISCENNQCKTKFSVICFMYKNQCLPEYIDTLLNNETYNSFPESMPPHANGIYAVDTKAYGDKLLLQSDLHHTSRKSISLLSPETNETTLNLILQKWSDASKEYNNEYNTEYNKYMDVVNNIYYSSLNIYFGSNVIYAHFVILCISIILAVLVTRYTFQYYKDLTAQTYSKKIVVLFIRIVMAIICTYCIYMLILSRFWINPHANCGPDINLSPVVLDNVLKNMSKSGIDAAMY